MKRMMALAGLLVVAVAAEGQSKLPAAKASQVRMPAASCEDSLPHALTFAVPRTSLTEEVAAKLPQTLASLVAPMYVDYCGKGKALQINLAFGSDYEVIDWLERGRVDGGVVPDLSLWLLQYDENPWSELSAERAEGVEILLPRQPAPSCRRWEHGRWHECAAQAAYDVLLADIAAGKPVGARRVMFASHLSSTGFLDPIRKAVEVFSTIGDEARRDAAWETLFGAAHFTLDSHPDVDPFALALQEEGKTPPELTVIAFPGEEVIARGGTTTAPDAHVYREHLLLTPGAAAFFPGMAFQASDGSKPVLPGALQALLESGPPRPLKVIARGDPDSSARTYAFTMHESLRLLAQQQRSSGQSDLALVLPGGGVKAAYQSRIVDHLYGDGDLRNAGLPKKDGALEVRSVLGTSGGALLGYFVSQLGEKGPFDLADILWRPGGRTLQADDVFAATDMLRYASVVWTFMIFCIFLAFITGKYNSRFYVRSGTPNGSWRWRLMTVLIVFFAVPILIRYVTGGDDVEHVPVIEGIFYSLLTVLVMFCDQCLIYSKEVVETRSLGLHVLVLLGLGGSFVLLSIFGAHLLQEPVSIGFAFATLSVIFLGSPLLLLYANGRFETRRRLLDVLLSLVAVLILCSLGIPGRLPLQVRYLFALLALLGLAAFAYWHARQEKRSPLVGSILTFLTLFATAMLCWPATKEGSPRGLSFITTPAMESTHVAPFLASTGCLLLVIAVAIWVYQRSEYSVKAEKEFVLGLMLLLAHALFTGGIVVAIARTRPGLVHNIEMTPSFWMALTVIAAVLASAILVVARYSTGKHFTLLSRAVGFLTAEHPNGSLLPRRYARMLAVATFSLVWWNAMVTPALYGNDAARKYLKSAVAHFDARFRAVTGQKSSAIARGFIPTAKFVAPTNTLDDQESTRYFLFLAENAPKFDLPRRIAGAKWKVYATTTERVEPSDCMKKIDPRCAEFVQDVIFSSGSPFPIFAAHRVTIPGRDEKLGLIDGGYSNDIPIDAARTIAARQVLVVHSAPAAVEPERGRQAALSLSPGMLIRNVKRLPAFMFEQGQQVDRLSRQSLFVIGFAPLLEDGESWPGLAQFDAPTVEAMLEKAEKNIHQRIGIAESWGEPRFRFSQQILPPPDGARATKANRG